MQCKVLLFKEDDGSIPVVDWLNRITLKARDKLLYKIGRLRNLGHEIRRPEADYLRDGIYELRVRHVSVQYRILYFFYGRDVVILSHGLTKEQKVPDIEIQRAIERKTKYESDPVSHTEMI